MVKHVGNWFKPLLPESRPNMQWNSSSCFGGWGGKSFVLFSHVLTEAANVWEMLGILSLKRSNQRTKEPTTTHPFHPPWMALRQPNWSLLSKISKIFVYLCCANTASKAKYPQAKRDSCNQQQCTGSIG